MPRFAGFRTLLTVLSLTLVACSTTTMEVGQRQDASLMRQLVPGVSTVTDAHRLFGQPSQTIRNSNGQTVVVYAHTTSTGKVFGGSNVGHQSIILWFDESGRYLRGQDSSGSTKVQTR